MAIASPFIEHLTFTHPLSPYGTGSIADRVETLTFYKNLEYKDFTVTRHGDDTDDDDGNDVHPDYNMFAEERGTWLTVASLQCGRNGYGNLYWSPAYSCIIGEMYTGVAVFAAFAWNVARDIPHVMELWDVYVGLNHDHGRGGFVNWLMGRQHILFYDEICGGQDPFVGCPNHI